MAFEPVVVIRNSTENPSIIVRNGLSTIVVQSQGSQGPPGQRMILLGGLEGQVLGKLSDVDGDIAWVDPGGEVNLSHLADVIITDPQNLDGLVFDTSLSKWKNLSLKTVAFTGQYSDLQGKPSILAFSGTTKITVGPTQPTDPTVGDLWVDTN